MLSFAVLSRIPSQPRSQVDTSNDQSSVAPLINQPALGSDTTCTNSNISNPIQATTSISPEVQTVTSRDRSDIVDLHTNLTTPTTLASSLPNTSARCQHVKSNLYSSLNSCYYIFSVI